MDEIIFSLGLGADAVFAVFARGGVFDVFDDFRGDVATGDFFDAETWGGVDFEDERTARGAHQIDAADVEAHGASGLQGDLFLFVGEFHRHARAGLVEIGADIVVERGALHGGDDAVADDEGADVGAGGFFNIFLEEDVGAIFVVEVEGLESGFRGLLCLGENDAVAVGTGGELDDDGEADLVDKVVDVASVARDESFRSIDAVFC